ncbi:MAG TPA: cytochrome b N-terminal domain-containing protein, partial [Terriglobia bacterium]|nr:cytochrome b N-terminal domain-containing protein [Terriglobia bacterium]
ILQLVTGILLALIYVPSASEAWSSLQALNHQVALGWFIRAMHGWGSNFMVAIVLIHMVQVFLFGAHKFPRELTWVIGVFLLLMTLGMAFSGQVLRFDQDAYWGLGIGASIASRVPIAGPAIVKLMLGGPIIAGATLSRFFALHVFVIPGMLIAFVGLHVLMVLKLGINEWPMPGRVVKRATYERDYHALTKQDGAPFVPYAVWKDLFFAGFIILAVAACALYFGPFGPTGQPDPTIIQTAPKPDYFFLWLYALLSLLPPSMETPFLLIVPPVAIMALILLPFLSGEGEKSWKRRPIAVLTVLLIAITLGTFTRMAQFAPWSPHMNAWSGDPLPDRFVHGTSALERQGALVFQVKQCRNCHAVGNTGGQRGPSLDSVALRLTQDQLIRQVIQGGGNMPAYGNNLSPAETTALVAFLESLHPAGQAPARDASREVVLGDSDHKEAVAQR